MELFENKNIPSVHFNVLTTGIIVSSERLRTTRFIAFDTPGQCRSCKSDHLQIDHCITKNGIHLYSNRFKSIKYIEFDIAKNFPSHCFFTVKCRGRLYKIPHLNQEEPTQKKQKMGKPEEVKVKEEKMPAVIDSILSAVELLPTIIEAMPSATEEAMPSATEDKESSIEDRENTSEAEPKTELGKNEVDMTKSV
jgi:hypothetical protein